MANALALLTPRASSFAYATGEQEKLVAKLFMSSIAKTATKEVLEALVAKFGTIEETATKEVLEALVAKFGTIEEVRPFHERA
ncbi:hypothetical protein T484DRAFT_1842547 [Baffinella frigidus]|nr:hypothetical protein T484DRAFT_1842547 [Cryptophyta sp. CCMP2293]